MDEKLRKCFRFLNIAMVEVTPVAVTVPMFVAGIFAYHFTDLGNDAFVLPFPIWWAKLKWSFKLFLQVLIDFFFFLTIQRLPFDWQNPMGYSIAIALLYIFIFNAAFAAISLIVSAIGISFILISLTKDIANDLVAINKSARRIKRNPSQIVKQFVRFVQMHSHSMQLTRDFSELAKMMCTILFSWGAIAVCGTMLMLHMELVEYLK